MTEDVVNNEHHIGDVDAAVIVCVTVGNGEQGFVGVETPPAVGIVKAGRIVGIDLVF